MDFPQFEKYMSALLDYELRSDKFSEFLDMFTDGMVIPILAPNLVESYIKLLEAQFNDKGETISWWLYEACFDREKACMWTADGVEIPMRTIEDLYNCLATGLVTE